MWPSAVDVSVIAITSLVASAAPAETSTEVTLDGPDSGYNTGIGLAAGRNDDLYVSALVSHPTRGLDMWFGRFDVSTVFADGFEAGDTSSWSGATP